MSASHVWPGAEVDPRPDAMVVRTSAGAWTNAAAFAVPITTPGPDGFVFVSARTLSGRAGFSLLAADLATGISKETLLTGDARALIPLVVPEGHDLVHVLVRNASDVDEASLVQVFGTSSRPLPVVALHTTDVTTALRDPAALHADLVGRAWPELDPADVPAWERAMPVPVRVGVPVPLPLPPLDSVFDDEVGRVVLESVEDLRAAVARFDDSPVADHIATECRQDMYLQMNTVRVVRLVEALRRRGEGRRRLVEVGAWFGSFALPLARLGYEVTAVDRYDSYGRAFETFTDLMQESGVRVVSTTREEEDDSLHGLGPFDFAFAGAVIEHVPHTPRRLLERLVRAVEPGGLVAVDTPNLVRYWNRVTMTRGLSVFQPISEQFTCTPPWEGHHREYTASEIAWMLEQVGCRDVEAEWFDYNLLQFEVLPEAHVEALMAFLQDLSECDMVLAVGQVPATPAWAPGEAVS